MARFKLVQIARGRYGVIDEESDGISALIHSQPITYSLTNSFDCERVVDLLNQFNERTKKDIEVQPLNFNEDV